MTEQEAIRLIRILPTMCVFTDAYGEPIDSDAYYEAVDMAISALQAQDVSGTNVGDMISRANVIDTDGLDEQIRCEMCRNPMHTDRGCDGNCKYDEKLYERIMQILDERIKPLPSAQPEETCGSCLYRGLGWHDEPCDSCTVGGDSSHYKPSIEKENGWAD